MFGQILGRMDDQISVRLPGRAHHVPRETYRCQVSIAASGRVTGRAIGIRQTIRFSGIVALPRPMLIHLFIMHSTYLSSNKQMPEHSTRPQMRKQCPERHCLGATVCLVD